MTADDRNRWSYEVVKTTGAVFETYDIDSLLDKLDELYKTLPESRVQVVIPIEVTVDRSLLLPWEAEDPEEPEEPDDE
jgi:hypothetical protein